VVYDWPPPPSRLNSASFDRTLALYRTPNPYFDTAWKTLSIRVVGAESTPAGTLSVNIWQALSMLNHSAKKRQGLS